MKQGVGYAGFDLSEDSLPYYAFMHLMADKLYP